jgi:hypothetical protein
MIAIRGIDSQSGILGKSFSLLFNIATFEGMNELDAVLQAKVTENLLFQ